MKINVENAPFLVTKLKIQVLPCVLAFLNGVGVNRIIGFEGLGHSPDNFTAKDVEARLLQTGVLVRATVLGDGDASSRQARQKAYKNDEDNDDWD